MDTARTTALKADLHGFAADLARLLSQGAPSTPRQRWHYVSRRLNLTAAQHDCALHLRAAYAAAGDIHAVRAVSELVEHYNAETERAAHIVQLHKPDSARAIQQQHAARHGKDSRTS
ncbi:hypothetical protein [Streptomyces sp. NPDC001205]